MTRGVFAGLTTLDVVHRVRTHPQPNQKITAAEQAVAVGGPAANAALVFAALGGQATLVTALGRSPVADLIRRDLQAHGVQVLDAIPEQQREPPVSAAAVQMSSGERSVVSLDAVSTSTPIPGQLAGLISGADIVLVDGHYPQLGLAAAQHAAAQAIPVVLDAGRWKPAMPGLIPLSTDMVCSSDFRAPGDADTVPFLLTSGPVRVVVTRGGEPVCWWEGTSSGSVCVPTVAVTDTLGAGDAFHGAYAYAAVATGLDLPGRIAYAIGVATARVEVSGPRAWLDTMAAWRR